MLTHVKRRAGSCTRKVSYGKLHACIYTREEEGRLDWCNVRRGPGEDRGRLGPSSNERASGRNSR
jgi:hypothetical protein